MKAAIFTLAVIVFFSSAVMGCGRKGPLELPPEDDRKAEQNAAR